MPKSVAPMILYYMCVSPDALTDAKPGSHLLDLIHSSSTKSHWEQFAPCAFSPFMVIQTSTMQKLLVPPLLCTCVSMCVWFTVHFMNQFRLKNHCCLSRYPHALPDCPHAWIHPVASYRVQCSMPVAFSA